MRNPRRNLTGAAVIICLIAAAALAPGAQNLVPDPGFGKADFAPLPKDTTWLFHEIVLPSEAKKEGASVVLTGGKTFLHSSRFDVEAGAEYAVSLKAKGDGKVGVEFLWWTQDGLMAKPHRVAAVETASLGGGEKALSGSAKAPEDAAKAYIRIIVEEGTATVSSPAVMKK